MDAGVREADMTADDLWLLWPALCIASWVLFWRKG